MATTYGTRTSGILRGTEACTIGHMFHVQAAWSQPPGLQMVLGMALWTWSKEL